MDVRLQLNSAECPLWLQTLDEIYAADHQKIDALRRFFGLCLAPALPFPAVLVLSGGGGTGKTVVLGALVHMLGEHNCVWISAARMRGRKAPAELAGAMLCLLEEMPREKAAQETFKRIVSGETLTAEVKYRRDLSFRPLARYVLVTHDDPPESVPEAIWARLVVLRHGVRFDGAGGDPARAEKLRRETAGIFQWAVGGLASVVVDGGFTRHRPAPDDSGTPTDGEGIL